MLAERLSISPDAVVAASVVSLPFPITLFSLRRLKRFDMSPQIPRNFYSCTIKGILTGCIIVWYGNCTAFKLKSLQRVVLTAQPITGGLKNCQTLLPPETWTILHAPVRQEVPVSGLVVKSPIYGTLSGSGPVQTEMFCTEM